MPKFNKSNKKYKDPDAHGGDNGGGDSHVPAVRAPEFVEKRCHVCTSPHRNAIEYMLAHNTPYSQIERMFDGQIKRRSISNHDKEHLNYEAEAIRRITRKQAEDAQENYEEGVSSVLARRIFLEALVQKGIDALANNEVEITAKETMAAIQILDARDKNTEGVALEEIQAQLNAFIKAVQELTPPETWGLILDRARQLMGADVIEEKSEQGQLPQG